MRVEEVVKNATALGEFYRLWLAILMQCLEDAVSSPCPHEAKSARVALRDQSNLAMLVSNAGMPLSWVEKISEFVARMDDCSWVYDRPAIDAGNFNGHLDRLAKYSARAPEHHAAYEAHQAEKAAKQAAKHAAKAAFYEQQRLEREAHDAAMDAAHARRNEELRAELN